MKKILVFAVMVLFFSNMALAHEDKCEKEIEGFKYVWRGLDGWKCINVETNEDAPTEKYSNNLINSNDYVKIPINFVILEFNERIKFEKTLMTPSREFFFKTRTTEMDIKDDLTFTNDIWDQAKIKFYINNIYTAQGNTEDFKKTIKWFKEFAPNTPKKKYRWDKGLAKKNKKYIRLSNKRWKSYEKLINWKSDYVQSLVKNSDGLTVFYTPMLIPNDLTACGFAYNPMLDKSGKKKSLAEYYAVIPHMHLCREMKRGLILAHELGHILGLIHTDDQGGNVMSPGYVFKSNNNIRVTEQQKRWSRARYIQNQLNY